MPEPARQISPGPFRRLRHIALWAGLAALATGALYFALGSVVAIGKSRWDADVAAWYWTVFDPVSFIVLTPVLIAPASLVLIFLKRVRIAHALMAGLIAVLAATPFILYALLDLADAS
jgi:hypothetical protein